MVNSVNIQNFKSLRSVTFQPTRINLFIGEPNTGKSNILEALAFFSPGVVREPLFHELLRFKNTADLFFDQRVSQPLCIDIGDFKVSLEFKEGMFQGTIHINGTITARFVMSHSALIQWQDLRTTIRYYAFKPLTTFPNGQPGNLISPFGENLVAVLYSNEDLRQRIGAIVRSKGFRLQIKPTENELLIAKDVNDELYSYPWATVSETLRRIVFFMAVLETNENATLVLDEPEANTFPFYTKYLAERIALDSSNQFFITTHNPYLLSSIVEKAKSTELSVFVARMENFETKLSRIEDKRLPDLLELNSDAFFNLDKLVER